MDDRISFWEYAYWTVKVWCISLEVAYKKLALQCWKLRLWLVQNCW